MSHHSNSHENINRKGPSPYGKGALPTKGESYSLLAVTNNLAELEQLEKTNRKYRLPPTVKPCLLKLLGSKESLGAEEKWRIPSIIACELRRVGNTSKQVQRKLQRWGQARPHHVQSAVQYAFRKQHEYGCPRLENMGICLYESRYDCPWYMQIPRKGHSSYRERDFYNYDWARALKCSEQCIYFAIRELERRRGWPSGSCLFVCDDEMGRVAGVCPKTARTGLAELSRKGLIRFKKGEQHRHRGIAGEICRIIPIPKPKSVRTDHLHEGRIS